MGENLVNLTSFLTEKEQTKWVMPSASGEEVNCPGVNNSCGR